MPGIHRDSLATPEIPRIPPGFLQERMGECNDLCRAQASSLSTFPAEKEGREGREKLEGERIDLLVKH